MNQKRCLTIQDYSCMGRCSLTVALPIISACGIECVGLPTAVLSNHTAFDSWTYVDLTDQMLQSVEKWKNYNNKFDCIYTGYLGNGQSKIVIDIIKECSDENTVVVVDPAYGDNGKLYPGFDQKHVEEMKELISYADLICPNLTEACTLLGREYKGECVSEEELLEISRELAKQGPQAVVLTGVLLEDGSVGCSVYVSEDDYMDMYFTECLDGRYHGAGDTFASALVGALLDDVDITTSVKIAHDFVHESIRCDLKDHLDGIKYGLEFEKNIPYLIERISKKQ